MSATSIPLGAGLAGKAGSDFLSLDELPLDVSSARIEQLFMPFVAREFGAFDPAWWRRYIKRRAKIDYRYAKARLRGFRRAPERTEDVVRGMYAHNWGRFDFGSYDPSGQPPKPYTLWTWRRRAFEASLRGGARVRLYLLSKVIERLGPKKVLEVGSGNGINLLLLACRFPEISFVGVELTPQGLAAARSIQALEALPENFAAFAPFEIRDGEGFRKVEFVEGSAADLPIASRSFDLVYTSLALEQMEQIRERALGEIARASGGHAFFCEPFGDVNTGAMPFRYVYLRDYFRGRVSDLPRYGLEPLWATSDFPHKITLRAAAVLARCTSGETIT